MTRSVTIPVSTMTGSAARITSEFMLVDTDPPREGWSARTTNVSGATSQGPLSQSTRHVTTLDAALLGVLRPAGEAVERRDPRGGLVHDRVPVLDELLGGGHVSTLAPTRGWW